jgi:catabolite repression protein CreC
MSSSDWRRRNTSSSSAKVMQRNAVETSTDFIGIYQLRDSLFLATPPPHPSEASTQPQNPLDTTRKPPTAGSKISLASLAPKTAALLKPSRTDTPTSESSAPSSHGGSQVERISDSSIHSNPAASRPLSDIEEPFKSPVFGQDNPALTQVNAKEGKDAAKKKKPKNSMVKTNSSYVSRVSPAENLSRRLNEHDPNGIFVFINVNRSFQWLDLSANAKTKVIQLGC